MYPKELGRRNGLGYSAVCELWTVENDEEEEEPCKSYFHGNLHECYIHDWVLISFVRNSIKLESNTVLKPSKR